MLPTINHQAQTQFKLLRCVLYIALTIFVIIAVAFTVMPSLQPPTDDELFYIIPVPHRHLQDKDDPNEVQAYLKDTFYTEGGPFSMWSLTPLAAVGGQTFEVVDSGTGEWAHAEVKGKDVTYVAGNRQPSTGEMGDQGIHQGDQIMHATVIGRLEIFVVRTSDGAINFLRLRRERAVAQPGDQPEPSQP